jgi:hypothetical protein
MNSSQHAKWEGLLTVLAEAHSLFQEFLGLLSHEERYLRMLNRHELSDVNSKKEHVLNAMLRIEQQIERGLHQLVGFNGRESIWSCLKQARDPRAQRASVMLTDLIRLASVIQEQGQTNTALICRIQHRVSEVISFIYAGLGGAGPVYRGSGILTYPSVPSSVHLQG